MANINCLPPEILLKIFRLYLLTETQNDLINCIGKVCGNWQKLCKDPSLWQEFDGTLPYEVLKEYCKEGILKKCKKLVFTKMEYYNYSLFKELLEVCDSLPLLNCVNFSNVFYKRSNNFYEESGRNPECQENISCDKLYDNKTRLTITGLTSMFKFFLSMSGKNLVSLIFSNIYLPPSVQLFSIISNSCPNLEVLKVENVFHDDKIKFPTGQMQSRCPNLRILCLGYPVTIMNHAYVSGFKNLEILRNPSKLNYLFSGCSVEAAIFESPKLKELDISQCIFARGDCLHPVNYSHLENLNISSGEVYDITCFRAVIHKWSDSLKVLDVSKILDISLIEVLQSVILDGGLSNLTALNLGGTSITIPLVKLIVDNCPQLQMLNLELCNELEEFRLKYEGGSAIKMLGSRLLSLGY